MERELIGYLPPILAETAEMKGICRGEQPQFDIIWTETDRLLRELYVPTAVSEGLSRWEETLGLIPDGEAEERRRRILLTLIGERPYTIKWLKNYLESVLGDVWISVNTDDFYLSIETGSENEALLGTLQKSIRAVIPANIELELSGMTEKFAGIYAGCMIQVTDTVDLTEGL